MKQNVWILNHYAGDTFFDKGGRHYWIAKYLHRKDYNPVVFCCNVEHGTGDTYCKTGDLWVERVAEEIDVRYVFVRSNSYQSNGLKRIQNMFGFYRNVKKTCMDYAGLHGMPDIIYASSVHPLTLVAGIELAKRFDVPCICEVRDLWPETLFVFISKLRRDGLLGKALCWGEKWLYKKADALIFTMEGGRKYIIDQGWSLEQGGPIDLSKVFYINNGFDPESFYAWERTYAYTHSEYIACKNARVVYTGSIRKANDMSFIIDVADCLRNDSIDVFLFGTGDEEERARQEVAKRHIYNLHFMGRVEKKYIPSVLSNASLLLLSITQPELSKYGTSQNKMSEYLASGKPIISNQTNDYSDIIKYHCGIDEEFRSPEECATAIRNAISNPEQLRSWGNNAKSAAGDFSFKIHTDKLIKIIESVERNDR